MIVDMNTELRDFIYITNVYKCISNYDLRGHQIGRKIGDMLEILTMGAIYKNQALKARLLPEQKLEGYTTAGHKVEFGFFHNINDKNTLFGAIECKCVGVEETVYKQNNKHLQRLAINDSFDIDFSARWQNHPIKFRLTLLDIVDNRSIKVSIGSNSDNNIERTFVFCLDENIKVVIDENSHCLVTTPQGNMLDEIPTIIRICKTIRLKTIETGYATFALYNCLPGPQTIEKAKQASLVAMDLRKKKDNCWGKEEVCSSNKHMTFIHVLCEFSHWEEKSRNVIKTCIDHNIIVPDSVIIKAFELFECQFNDDMLHYISKKQFEDNQLVRSIIYNILEYYENKIFYDIETNQYVKLDFLNNSLVLLPL